MPPSDPLTSPGRATSDRLRLEIGTLRATRRALAHWWRTHVSAAVTADLDHSFREQVLTVLVSHLPVPPSWLPDRTAERLLASPVPSLAAAADPDDHADDYSRAQSSLDGQARTEVTRSFAADRLASLADAGYTAKRWVTMRDEFVRPSHARADGQTVPLSAAFTVGDEALAYPGDPAGSPAQTYNCRCVLVGVG